MHALSALGETVARRWRAENHDESCFAAIATDALTTSGVLAQLRGDDIVRWALGGARLPAQSYTGFGQPPVVLYRGHDFYIEALFWFDGTTAIHQHGFSGAFAVLEGSSVHTRYDFVARDRVNSRIVLGALRFQACEVLERGAVRAIEAGDRFIHALFHLERPSVSLVVRTSAERDHYPQYTYHRPGLAIDPFHQPEPMMTQLRLLEVVHAAKGALALREAATTLLRDADFWLTYRILELVHRALDGDEPYAEIERCARERLGARIEALAPVFVEQRRQRNIVARREHIHDQQHRFLLGLLLNVPTRAGIDALLRQRHPDVEPRALIARWLGELAGEQKIGLDFAPLSLVALEHALDGGQLDELRGALARTFSAREVAAQDAALSQLWREIHEASLLQPLFAPCS